MAGKTLLQRHKNLQLKMQIQSMKSMIGMIQSIPSFARDADESSWRSITIGKEVYTENEVHEMQQTARKLYYTDPGARGVIDMMVNFVVGKDAYIKPLSKNKTVIKFWETFCTINKMDRRMKEHVRRSLRDGESLLRLFKPKRKSKVKIPLIRFIEPDDLKDKTNKWSFGIETDPEDVEDIIRYHLCYKNDSGEIKNTKVDAKYVVHTKINVDMNVKRGVSFLVGVAKYIVKYGGWLNDRIMLNKIRTLFNMVMKVSGVDLDTFENMFDDATTKTKSGGTAPKKLPKAGSILLSTPGIEYDMMNLDIHAPDTQPDGRAIELMISKGTGLTEYVVRGDASNSNYSSTMVSESPMVRMFEAWQDYFKDEFKETYRKVMCIGKEMGVIPKNSDEECEVIFSALIHRDIKDETEALAVQRSLGWVSDRTSSHKLGYIYDNEKKQIKTEDKEKEDKGFNKEESTNDEE